jgi:hypothetical protein
MRTPILTLLAVLGLAALVSPAAAQVFKCKQSSGLVVYSDKPCEFSMQTTDVRLVRSAEDSSQFARPSSEPATTTADASAPPAKPAAPVGNASTLLRAMGPDQALDKQGKVYKATGGYLHASGTYIPGIARGHR